MEALNPATWSLSRKFVSIIFLILLIPLASIGLLKEIEKTLKNNLTDNLLLTSKLIANQLEDQKKWFEQSLLPDSSKFLAKELFVFPLDRSYSLDGYFEDWINYEPHRQVFSDQHVSFGVLLGNFEQHLVLSIQVTDPQVIYPSANSDTVSDQIEIEFKNKQGNYQQLYLSARTAGDFPVKTKKSNMLTIDWRFKATWVESDKGFNVEVQFPSGIKPQQIKVIYRNVTQANQKQFFSSLYSGFSSDSDDLNPLVWPSEHLIDYFDKIELSPAQRIWLIDTHRRVLVSSGDLKTGSISFSSNPLLNWILASQSEIETDPRKNNLHLDSKEIYRALKGKVSSRIENIKNSDQSIALAAIPIKIENKIYAVLLLEENIARMQIPQKKTLIRMFTIILIVFLLVMWIVFWYVSRLVGRIKHLNQAIEEVVDPRGRMKAPLSLNFNAKTMDRKVKGDEIDELYSAFSQMGAKLYEYNDHLEKLASRLSHELRTPIAIVRSSLDNLLITCEDQEDRETINRALQGNVRLGEIISRMRQASSVKEAMQNAHKENINLDVFLQQLTGGYKLSFSDFEFYFDSNAKQKEHNISADLFSEMLDKLISNAMEFSPPNGKILIQLTQSKNGFCLSVSNTGPTIAKKDLKKIFHSLVSIRNNQQSTGTNLGLGLYVVRLIAEFHNASIKAENRQDGSGVVFSLCW